MTSSAKIARPFVSTPLPHTVSDATPPSRSLMKGQQTRAAILAWYDFVNWAIDKRVDHDVAQTPDVNHLARRKLDALRDELVEDRRVAAVAGAGRAQAHVDDLGRVGIEHGRRGQSGGCERFVRRRL